MRGVLLSKHCLHTHTRTHTHTHRDTHIHALTHMHSPPHSFTHSFSDTDTKTHTHFLSLNFRPFFWALVFLAGSQMFPCLIRQYRQKCFLLLNIHSVDLHLHLFIYNGLWWLQEEAFWLEVWDRIEPCWLKTVFGLAQHPAPHLAVGTTCQAMSTAPHAGWQVHCDIEVLFLCIYDIYLSERKSLT